MDNQLLTQMALILLCLAEIPHDKAQILDSKFDLLQQKRWHLWSGIYYCMIVVFFAYFTKAPYYGILLLAQSFAIRLIVFGNGLNVARNKNFFYLGDKGIDGQIKKTIGGIGLFIICSLALIISNVLICIFKFQK